MKLVAEVIVLLTILSAGVVLTMLWVLFLFQLADKIITWIDNLLA